MKLLRLEMIVPRTFQLVEIKAFLKKCNVVVLPLSLKAGFENQCYYCFLAFHSLQLCSREEETDGRAFDLFTSVQSLGCRSSSVTEAAFGKEKESRVSSCKSFDLRTKADM